MKPTPELAPLPDIPRKRYFAIGEVSELCAVKAHVLRYWEQEFPQLKPAKRRGNRRYYQQSDIEMVRRISSLLYEQGYTIGAARLRLRDALPTAVTPLNRPALPVEPENARTVSPKDPIRELRLELEALLKRWPS